VVLIPGDGGTCNQSAAPSDGHVELEKTAAACDKAFPERRGWFTEYYFELQTWAETPSWFKPWSDHEMSTATIRAWSPLTVHGLLQTEDYARAVNSVEPRVTRADS
jgi:Domain of unknown function (DUF5753)